MAESKEEIKSLLIKVKEESEKVGLKLNIKKTKIMASGPITLWQIDEEKWKQWQVLFWGAPKLLWMVTKAMELKTLTPWKKNYDKSRQHIKKQKHHFANKGPDSQSCCFSSRHVWMWELDHKEGWAPKYRCFWSVVLEKTLESPLDCKEINLVNSKGKKTWIFTGRTMVATWWGEMTHIGKDPDAGKDWRQEEKGMTEDEMVVWHHQLNGHKL